MQFNQLKRRDFITLLGGAAITSPLAAHAQQPAMPVIGLLAPVSQNEELLRAFRQGLQQAGFAEGENVLILYRSAEYEVDRLPTLAEDLARRRVDVIATFGHPAVFAAKAATATIPIVFIAAEDPVKLGFVASLARPGGNLTGVNLLGSELVAKRLQFLRELVPASARIAVLVDPANPTIVETTLRDLEPAAHAMGLQIRVLNASNREEINAAFATFVRERPDALFISIGTLFTARRVQLATLAARHMLPMSSGNRQITEAGGLMSYGVNIAEAYHQVGVYVARILIRRQTSRLAGGAVGEVRAGHQRRDRTDAQSRRTAIAACRRRRGYRVSLASAHGLLHLLTAANGMARPRSAVYLLGPWSEA